jgi:AhpD family alkylhydroperoxidase
MTPNMMKTMAQSPAVLEAYLNFSGALAGGTLSGKLREQIALIAAEVNGCGYCASAHTAIGKMVGLDEAAISSAREGNAINAKDDAALKFARTLIVNRGQTSDADLRAVKEAGFTGGEVGEIVANVALNVFTNYFNETAQTEVDFPAIEFPLKSRSANAS